VQRIPAAAGVSSVEFEAEIIPAEEPVEGSLSLFRTTKAQTSRGALRGRPTPSLAPRSACWSKWARVPPRRKNPLLPMGRKWPFSEVWTSASQRKVCRPRSINNGWPMSWPLRIRACASLALSYVSSSSNQGQSACAALPPYSSIQPAGQCFAVCVTRRSPLSRRRYSWIPIRANAHARGEVKVVTVGSAGRRVGRTSPGSCDRANAPRPGPAPTALAVTIFRARFVQPPAVEAQMVVKAFGLEIQRVIQEGRVSGSQRARALRLFFQLIEEDGQDEGPGVIVGAVNPRRNSAPENMACWKTPDESVHPREVIQGSTPAGLRGAWSRVLVAKLFRDSTAPSSAPVSNDRKYRVATLLQTISRPSL